MDTERTGSEVKTYKLIATKKFATIDESREVSFEVPPGELTIF